MRSRGKIALGSGFVSDCVAGRWIIRLAANNFMRLIGRQAPVKRCLARCRDSKNEIRNSKIDEAYGEYKSAVRKHLSDGGYVSGTDQRQLLEFAHAAWSLCAHQVAFAGVHAFDFAVRGDLEALFGAAMRFQFQFWFRRIPWHGLKYSPSRAGLVPPL